MFRENRRLSSYVVFLVSIVSWFGLFLLAPSFSRATALGDLANSMQPGTWAQLTTNNTAILRVGPTDGNMLPYSMSAVWDATNHNIHYIGMDHGYPQLRHVYYDEATNAWVLKADNAGLGAAHGYDHLALNTFTKEMFHRQYDLYNNNIYKYSPGGTGGSWSHLINARCGLEQVAIGLGFWSGTMTGVTPGVGAYVVYNSGEPNGIVCILNPSTGAVMYTSSGFGGTSTYHSFFEYSPTKNVAVFGGGNDNVKKIWRLNSDRTVTAMPDAPGSVTLGIYQGFVTADPATGNFLVLSNGQLWEFNPSGSGTWTQLPAPPAYVGNPRSLNDMITVPIDTYGVVMYVWCMASSCNVSLYKHAAGSGSTTPPPSTSAPTVSISASPTSVVSGGASTLTWSSTNASSCTASGGWSGTKAISGSQSTGNLTANTTFTLTCTGTAGSANQSASVTVTSSTASFDFSLANGGNKSVTQGQSTSNTISATLLSGTAQAVTFSTSGLPSGAGASFLPTSCTPACSTAMSVATAASTAAGSYPITVTATGGGITKTTGFTLTVTTATTPPLTAVSSDFSTRCAAAGVVLCNGFDTATDLGTSGCYNCWRGIFHNGQAACNTSASNHCPTIDTTTKSDGAGSMKITVGAGLNGTDGGQFYTNFSSNYLTQFGANSDFYVSWRQRFDDNYIYAVRGTGGSTNHGFTGMKQGMVGTGSEPSQSYSASSCTNLEIPSQNNSTLGVWGWYQNCGRYEPLRTGPVTSQYATYDYRLQNGRPDSPGCWYYSPDYNHRTLPQFGNCIAYLPNTWQTVKMRIRPGSYSGGYFTKSTIEVWIAAEGGQWVQTLNITGYSIGPISSWERYGAIWFLTYSGTDVYPNGGTTWIDELIISTADIAAPNTSTTTQPPGAPSNLAIQ